MGRIRPCRAAEEQPERPTLRFDGSASRGERVAGEASSTPAPIYDVIGRTLAARLLASPGGKLESKDQRGTDLPCDFNASGAVVSRLQ
jgi:hypothetical protein